MARPTKAAFAMISDHLMGLADLDEVQAFLAKEAARRAAKETNR